MSRESNLCMMVDAGDSPLRFSKYKWRMQCRYALEHMFLR